MKEPIRVLQIVGSLSSGSGVLMVVLNWHRYIDTSKVQFDYLYFKAVTPNRQQEIEQLGGKCYLLPNPIRRPFKFLWESYRFFKMHRYTTVHSHVTHLNLFFFPLAKWFGAKNIVHHAHASKWGFSFVSNIRNYLMLHTVWPFITQKIACSSKVGKIYYGKDFSVIKNGINVEKFVYNPQVREQKRKELGIENNFVIGHVGRFSVEKNHIFLIDVFEQLVKQEPAAKLVLVGDGELAEKIKTAVVSKKLQDKVIFLGIRKDVAELYQAFDVFVLPSLHEGFPVAGVEAQTSGLPCVFADTITPEVLLLPSSCMLSLNDSAAVWAQKISSFVNKPRVCGVSYVREKGFSSLEIAKQIQAFYQSLETL